MIMHKGSLNYFIHYRLRLKRLTVNCLTAERQVRIRKGMFD